MLEKLFFLVVAALTICVAYFVSHLLLKTKQFQFLVNRSGRYGAIDGLRGYLALLVFIYHFELVWHWRAHQEWAIPADSIFKNFGVVAVNIFFMITGFLFISKLIKDNYRPKWKSLFISRFFRIYPLYISLLIGMSLLIFIDTNFQLFVKPDMLFMEYIDWLTFESSDINNYSDSAMMTAQVQWTLKYEWFFYLSLPLIALFLRNGLLPKSGLLIILVLGTVYPVTVFGIKSSILKFFVYGTLAAYAFSIFPDLKELAKTRVVSIVMSIAIVASLFVTSYGPIYVFLLPVFFIPIVYGNDFFGLFSKNSSILLGEISYGIYLLHGFLLFYSFRYLDIIDFQNVSLFEFSMLTPFIVVLLIIISSIAYLKIEMPGIKFGKAIASRGSN